MPLDSQTQAVLEMMAAMGAPPIHAQSVDDARQAIAAMSMMGGDQSLLARLKTARYPDRRTIRCASIRLKNSFPSVFFHGGGGLLAISIAMKLCRTLTNKAGCINVPVDYRLAPGTNFLRHQSCYAATKWVAENAATFNGDPARVAVGGDSAGGNLAAVVPLMARDRGGPSLVYQLLIYPATDYYLPGTPSIRENGEGYFLTRDDMIWFLGHYLSSEADIKHPYAFPLQAKDLSGLPPAMVITAEFDPLRDEGEIYAVQMKQAGGDVTSRRYDGTIHGFVSLSGMIDQGKKALADAAAGLRSAFGNG
jgi:acetyl esterase